MRIAFAGESAEYRAARATGCSSVMRSLLAPRGSPRLLCPAARLPWDRRTGECEHGRVGAHGALDDGDV